MRAKRAKVCKIILLVALIQAYNACRRRCYLTKYALLPPNLTPWQRLLDFGDEQSFLLMTGMSKNGFLYLEDVLFGNSHRWMMRRRRGRPFGLDEKGLLGLYLFYIGSKMQSKHLCMIFGVTPSACSRIVNMMIKLVVRKLETNVHAAITFPDDEKQNTFAAMISRREPTVRDVVGFMDGLSVPCECSSDPLIQNAFYNGYHSDTMVNNVLVFGPDGKVFICCLNFPGSWHDGGITANILPFLKEKLRDKKLCVDQGFPRSGDAYDLLVGPYSARTVQKLNPILRPYLLKLAAVYISLRQASEWGMRGLQGTFPRLKSRLTSDTAKRHLIILGIILTHNFRTSMVGLNQIAEVFNPQYEQYAVINLHRCYHYHCACVFY